MAQKGAHVGRATSVARKKIWGAWVTNLGCRLVWQSLVWGWNVGGVTSHKVAARNEEQTVLGSSDPGTCFTPKTIRDPLWVEFIKGLIFISCFIPFVIRPAVFFHCGDNRSFGQTTLMEKVSWEPWVNQCPPWLQGPNPVVEGALQLFTFSLKRRLCSLITWVMSISVITQTNKRYFQRKDASVLFRKGMPQQLNI